MIRHFFLDKTNTIIQGSEQNMGLNPVLHIGYGKQLMRGLLHFDECEIRSLIEDKTFANEEKLRFTLKMTNYFSIDGIPYENPLVHSFSGPTKRAASFDLVLFKLPCDFDEGRGFDFVSDFWVKNNKSFSKEGSNWYFCKSGILWDSERKDDDGEIIIPDVENIHGGIYPFSFLTDEYQKFLNGEDSIIIASQHFDFGDENLSMDITNYVLECTKTGINNGLCLAFSPFYEEKETDMEQYVGFVDDNTNTFFHPYVEAEYSDFINDDRESFTIGRSNNLFLYVSDNGEPANLDTLPSCDIDGVPATSVRQVTKGVYCAEIDANSLPLEEGAIYYDRWSQIALNGRVENDVELEFSTRPKSYKTRIGSDSSVKRNLVPSLYGINDSEKLHRGEVREVVVDFRQEYDAEKKFLVDSAEYRLYVKDGNREVEIIKYHPVEKAFLNNFFLIYAEDLIPNAYYVDIRVKLGRETKYFKERLRFKVVSDVTERYQ